MKIQLKRSNVLENSSAKLPTASQLEYGELAVNYNESDPAVFLKDSNNNIIRISGVGNIADDGQVEVPALTNPSSLTPDPGNLWYNTTDGRLYIYFQDADSSQWVDASPDSWDPTVLPNSADDGIQSGTIDERYVSKVATTSQDIAGDITLGTNKITLDAGDGSATFTDGNITLAKQSGNTGGYRMIIKNEDDVINTYVGKSQQYGGAPADQTYFQIIDTTPGNVHSTFSVKGDGSAEFSGNIVRRYSDNEYISIGNNATDVLRYRTDGSATGQKVLISKDGSAIFASGLINLNSGGTANFYRKESVDGALSLMQLRSDFGSIEKTQIRFNVDGSASFAGGITADNMTLAGPLNADGGVKAFGPTNSYKIFSGGVSSTETFSISGGGSATFAGSVYTPQVIADQPNDANQVFLGRTNGVDTIKLSGNGSASFSGDVQKGGNPYQGGEEGVALVAPGKIMVCREDGTTFESYDKGNATPTISMSTDGSASFAGGITNGSFPSGNGLKTDVSHGILSIRNDNSGASNGTEQAFRIYSGGSSSTNVTALITASGGATFAGTVSAQGSVLTRASGDLDVGERLEKADNALQALKTAAAAASDFAALKAAIATALADI